MAHHRKQEKKHQEETLYKLSIGFEELLYRLQQQDRKPEHAHFDIIIVGSGYGGSIAAAELSKYHKADGTALSICLLERGNEYAPGQFPSHLSDLAGHTRINTPASHQATGNTDGLFDIRVGNNISAVLGNGLGGGSLINAGVMEIPKPSVFDHRWPEDLQNGEALNPYYQEAKVLLGAATQKPETDIITSDTISDNTIELHQTGAPPKNQALKAMAKSASYRPAAITVAMADKKTCSQMQLNACNYCGDCATGCNHGAKESLDTNLLDLAQQQGVTLVTGATVKKLDKDQHGLWQLHSEYTNKDLQKRHGEIIKLRAGKVIIAAGTYGSNEILMRSVNKQLPLSKQLGERFSGNGDMIASAYQQKQTVNSVAREEIHPEQRCVGPTITGVIEAGRNPKGEPYVFEELAVPAGIRQLFEELTTTADLLTHLNKSDNSEHTKGPVKQDICAVNPDAISRTSVLAAFGDDGSQGRLSLNANEQQDKETGNGCISAHWPELGQHPLFDTQIQQLRKLCQDSDIKGKILPNPMWKFLPDDMDFLAESDLRGPLLTVHPLGGCAMADNGRDGVVNQYGQVYKGDHGEQVYQDLVVLDGAIIPSALCTNPALTIASVTLRASRQLSKFWGLKSNSENTKLSSKPRPLYHNVLEDFPRENAEEKYLNRSQFKLGERLGGALQLGNQEYYLDLTASYKASSIKRFSLGQENTIELDPNDKTNSHLRIFKLQDWQQLNNGSTSEKELEAKLDLAALYKASIDGKLVIFEREASKSWWRKTRGLYAWALNRGLRDSYQAIANKISKGINAPSVAIRKRIKNAFALASRAGEVRTLRYTITPIKVEKCQAEFKAIAQHIEKLGSIQGVKRLSYTRRANPWRQLMEMRLENFPTAGNNPVLKLDTRFLAKQGAPLFQISKQQDQPTAMADGLSFIAYAFRLLINNQLWSFRQPDPHNPAEPQRLAGKLAGLPTPEVTELRSGENHRGQAAYIRLTRYRGKSNSGQPPIVMLHGYSNSSTSFAHKSLSPNLASYFWDKGHDIWLLDLRTSSGLASATYPWTFEDVAFNDIPLAVDHIYRETGQKINVLAHCMSAAMLSMSVLKAPDPGDNYFAERQALPDRIRCVAFSQVGPRVNFSNDNVLRAYFLHYMRQFLPLANYSFRPEGEASLLDLLLDRLLYTLPYPEHEFHLENPPLAFWKKSSFVQNRHRMDALYGRSFSLKNVDKDVLNYIDDLFGPLSIETVSQAIHFTRWQSITNKQGLNDYVSRKNFKQRWRFPTFSVHGKENGLADVSTVKLMEQAMADAGLDYDSFIFEDHGHQDCLIGRQRLTIYDAINGFYRKLSYANYSSNNNSTSETTLTAATASQPLSALKPWIGPHIGQWHEGLLEVNIGSSPGLTPPLLAVAVPVKRTADGFEENRNIPRHLRSESNIDSSMDNNDEIRAGLFPAAMSRSGMVKLQLPERLWQQGSDGVLLFFIHDDDAVLNNPIFARGLHTTHTQPEPEKTLQQELSPRLKNETGQSQEQQLRQALYHRSRELTQAIDEAIEAKLTAPVSELEPAYINHSPIRNNSGTLRFAASSCQYPNGLLDKQPAYTSYQRLATLLEQSPKGPGFLLLMGDQIYVDATAGIFDPLAQKDRFRRPYQQLYQNPHVAEVRRKLPCYTMLDDHEIINDWEPIDSSSPKQQESLSEQRRQQIKDHQQMMDEGRQAFQQWQNLNPSMANSKVEDLWYSFEEKGIPFFIADSRTAREHRYIKTFKEANILGKRQFKQLCQWLLKNQQDKGSTPKFIASPAMPFPRTRKTACASNGAASLGSDGWDGFDYSLKKISHFIVENDIENVVFLSGDAHMSLVSSIDLSLGQKQQQLFSIHSSGMYAPYPFANAKPQDFALNENFSWAVQQQELLCQVKTDAQHIDCQQGFALIDVEQNSGQWQMSVQFSREQKTQRHQFVFSKNNTQATDA